MIPNDVLKTLLALGLKDKKRMTFIIAFLVVCTIGIGSIFILGPNNVVEKDAEVVAEDMIEYELHIPDGSIVKGVVDTTKPEAPKRNSYINND